MKCNSASKSRSPKRRNALLCLLWMPMVVTAQADTAEQGAIDPVDLLLLQAPELPVAQLLVQVQAALQAGQKLRALKLLAAQEVYHAGNPAFDRALARAMAENGQYTRAVLAYERVLAEQPDDSAAKAEVASLHFAAGDNMAAMEMFQELRSQALPVAVLQQVDVFLRTLNDRVRQPRNGWMSWMVTQVGHDSNVNTGVLNSQIVIPSLGVVSVAGSSLERKSSRLAGLQVGARWSQPLSSVIDAPDYRDCRLQFEATALTVKYAMQEAYNQDALTADYSINCPTAGFLRDWTFGVNHSHGWVDGAGVRQTDDVRVQHDWNYARASVVGVAAKIGTYKNISQPGNIGNTYLTNVNWNKKLGEQEQFQIGSNLFYRQEIPNLTSFNWGGFSATQLQVHARYVISPDWSMQIFRSRENRNYLGINTIFDSYRKDQDSVVALGLNWVTSADSLLSLNVSQQINQSNQSFYNYERRMVTVSWRREL